MSEDQLESSALHQYRLRARAWVADNLVQDGGRDEKVDDPSPERQAADRLLQAKLYEAGYAGITFPVEYGGQGLTPDHERVFLEEAAGYYLAVRVFGVSINILGAALAAFGTHEQKLAFLPDILSGKKLWLQLLSEPSGGSDLAGLLTSATRDGDSFVVNGQKTWSTRAHLSDYALCPVRTAWDVPKHKGISVLIVDLKSPGIEVRRIKQIDGGSEFCEEFFSDMLVPVANLVGDENDGWRVTRGLLEIEHSWIGRGGARGSNDQGIASLVALAQRRGLDSDVAIRRQLVDLHVRSTVQNLVVTRVSNGIANHKLPAAYGGVLKLGNDALLQRRVEFGLTVAGTSGVTWPVDQPAEQEWANGFLASRGASIAGGTGEIQRNNISEGALGLPREHAFDRDIPFNQVPHN